MYFSVEESSIEEELCRNLFRVEESVEELNMFSVCFERDLCVFQC